jgi:type II secretory pathway component PulK
MRRLQEKSDTTDVIDQSPRRGAVAVVVLLAILVIFSLGLTMLQTTLKERERTLQFEERQQSAWLAEAGIERAAYQLRTNPDYAGELWKLSKDELAGKYSGQVEIQIIDNKDNNGKSVTVIADYPNDIEHRIRTRREIVVDVGVPTNN